MPKTSTSEIIYNEVMKRCEFEFERFKHLDDKASNTISFIGILIGLISGFGSLSLKFPVNPADAVPMVLFSVSLILLFLSFLFSLKAFQIKKFTIVPNAYFLIGEYENKEKAVVVQGLYDNYAVAIEDNMKINDEKSKNINACMH